MAAGKRLKGQEVELRIVATTGEVRSLQDIKSFTFTFDIDTLEEGYLGQKSNSFDDIYKGVEGDLEAHIEKGEVFDFVQQAIDRMKAAVQTVQFHANCTAQMPDGTVRRFFFNNIFFGSMPFSIGGRAEYVTMKTTFKCSECRMARG